MEDRLTFLITEQERL